MWLFPSIAYNLVGDKNSKQPKERGGGREGFEGESLVLT